MRQLAEFSYSSIRSIRSKLLVVDGVLRARLGEAVLIRDSRGNELDGEVLMIDGGTVLVQVFGEGQGLDLQHSRVVFSDQVRRTPLAETMLNRVYDGSFRPLDDEPMFVPAHWAAVTGQPLNPAGRARPEQFIETGFSVIDGLLTLVKGQKLPVFSCAGLPAKELVAGILTNARLPRPASGESARFAIVFVALGLTFHEYAFYLQTIQEMRTDFVALVNLADDPVVERLLAPRHGLTVAEYLAFALGMEVLVVITDMTNYCEALREVATAREELPGRRGYPGYLYSELASLYERAGRVKGRPGSVTLLPVLTMPEDDLTHPIPDLTGYITEGQVVLDRELHQQGVFPPVDVLPSLSRLMQRGIGPGRTRGDHRQVADALYRWYARGRELRALEVVVGREGLSAADRRALDFAAAFEQRLVAQQERRTIGQTLDLGKELLARFRLAAPPAGEKKEERA